MNRDVGAPGHRLTFFLLTGERGVAPGCPGRTPTGWGGDRMDEGSNVAWSMAVNGSRLFMPDDVSGSLEMSTSQSPLGGFLRAMDWR